MSSPRCFVLFAPYRRPCWSEEVPREGEFVAPVGVSLPRDRTASASFGCGSCLHEKCSRMQSLWSHRNGYLPPLLGATQGFVRYAGGFGLRITKAGDEHLRWMLVAAAQRILGPLGSDSDLRPWGLALAAKGGKNAKKRAVVAVARKLAVLLLRLWQTGEAYEPLRNAKRREGALVCT